MGLVESVPLRKCHCAPSSSSESQEGKNESRTSRELGPEMSSASPLPSIRPTECTGDHRALLSRNLRRSIPDLACALPIKVCASIGIRRFGYIVNRWLAINDIAVFRIICRNQAGEVARGSAKGRPAGQYGRQAFVIGEALARYRRQFWGRAFE